MVDGAWRRVPESNQCTRICNPCNRPDNHDFSGKQAVFVPGSTSTAYADHVNAQSAEDDTKNPGALAGAAGAEAADEATLSEDYSRAASRAIAALIEAAEAGDADACTMALRGLRRLSPGPVATIAALALGALDGETAEHVTESVIRHAGMPAPQPLMPMADARLWAGWASRAERKAYAACAFEALSAADRRAFRNRYFGEVAA